MSSFHNYDPDAMFPKKSKPKSIIERKAIRWLIIIGIGVLVIWIGAGCKNVRSIDAGFGGLEVEYWPSHPSQEDKSIFDFSSSKTNNWAVPANWNGPLLMPMNNNYRNR